MSANKGTPFDALFQALTERMGVLHTAYPDTDPSQRDRVEWRHPSIADGNRRYRKQGADFCGFLAVTYQVSVYGATELETVGRVAELVGWLDYLIGPDQGASDAGDGYQIGKSSVPVQGGDGDAAGYACALPVTLFVPVYQQIWGKRTVSSVSINVLALNALTDAPAGDPVNPIEVSG